MDDPEKTKDTEINRFMRFMIEKAKYLLDKGFLDICKLIKTGSEQEEWGCDKSLKHGIIWMYS